MGRRLAEVRVARGQTQEAAAAEAGVSVKYLQRVEGGLENLTIHSLVKLANVYRVLVAELFVAPKSRAIHRGRPPRTKTDG